MKAIASTLALSVLVLAEVPLSVLAQPQTKESTNSVAIQSCEVDEARSYHNGASTMKFDKAAGCNGSFEYSEAGLPVNWAVYTPLVKKKGCELKFDTTDAKDGKQSLEFIVRECSDVGGWHSPGIFQERKILPGRNYKTTFWLKNTGCRIKVDLATIKNPTHGHCDTVLKTSQVLTNWTKFEFSTQSYPGAIHFRFELNVLSPGNLWIDDLEIQEQ
jgi:hypothetical protein